MRFRYRNGEKTNLGNYFKIIIIIMNLMHLRVYAFGLVAMTDNIIF